MNVVVQVLQSVFLKCESVVLGGTILDAVSTIYHGDNANYFLLQVGGEQTEQSHFERDPPTNLVIQYVGVFFGVSVPGGCIPMFLLDQT